MASIAALLRELTTAVIESSTGGGADVADVGGEEKALKVYVVQPGEDESANLGQILIDKLEELHVVNPPPFVILTEDTDTTSGRMSDEIGNLYSKGLLILLTVTAISGATINAVRVYAVINSVDILVANFSGIDMSTTGLWKGSLTTTALDAGSFFDDAKTGFVPRAYKVQVDTDTDALGVDADYHVDGLYIG